MYTQQQAMPTPRMLDPKAEIAKRTSELNVSRMTQKYMDAETKNAPNKDMLRNFAEITYTLHMINMEMLEIKDMFHVLDDSLSIMDDCFNGFEQLMKNHMYTGQSARKTRREIRVFTKGVERKIKNMFRMLKSVSTISGVLGKALNTLRSPSLFGKPKKQKRGEENTVSPFDAYLAECRSKQGGAPADAAAPGGAAPAAAPSGGDVSDISDITGDI